MTYRIYEMNGPHRHTVADVAGFTEARDFLAEWGELIAFELDSDGHAAADAALVRKGGALQIFSIERR